MKKRRRRRDRVAAEEHLQPRQLRTRDEAQRERFRTGDRAVEAGLRRRRCNVMAMNAADLGRQGIAHADDLRGHRLAEPLHLRGERHKGRALGRLLPRAA